MPLDPQAKGFLDQLAAAGAPGLNELPIDEARQAIRGLFAVEAPEAVARVEDRTIPTINGHRGRPRPCATESPASSPTGSACPACRAETPDASNRSSQEPILKLPNS